MVKEINTTSNAGSVGFSPILATHSNLYFAATDGVNGTELWRSDSTTGGTVMVKDIQPGPGSSSPTAFVQLGSVIFFIANDGVNGAELWKTDGTESGTVLVKDIQPGLNSSSVNLLYAHNGAIYFGANNGTNGLELWKSDGTTSGTVMVRDINPGSGSGLTITAGNPYNFVSLNNELYFAANNGVNGRELWKSDGTTAGTVMVKDVLAGGTGAINSSKMVTWNGKVYFAANTSAAGTELWATDGSDAGTYLIKDIVSGSGNSSPNNLVVYNNAVYFTASPTNNTNADLWKTDGTEVGTTMVRNLTADGVALNVGLNNSINQFTVAGGLLYFASTGGPQGAELYVSDGTGAGTRLVQDINTGGNSLPALLIPFQNKLYFGAFISGNIFDLFYTDGTSEGTQPLTTGLAGTSFNLVQTQQGIAVLGGRLYFYGSQSQTGTELWRTDGTIPGTVPLKDINTVRAGASTGSILFGADTLNGFSYFAAANDTHGTELWKSDGTEAGTVMVKDIFPGGSSSSPVNIKRHGSHIYFQANNGTNGAELWRTDGTEAGTVMIADINPGPGGSSPFRLTSAGAQLYFLATHPDFGTELWTTDGTAQGYLLALDLSPGAGSGFSNANDNVSCGNSAYYISPAGRLYKAEGTNVTEFQPDIATCTDLGVLGDTLFILGRKSNNQSLLWTSINGGATTEVKVIANSGTSNYQLMAAGGKMYFNANNGTTGSEPWVSDGTPNGTFLLKDIIAGSAGSQPFQFVAAGNKVLFYARQINGNPADAELWATDGTPAGTYLVKDINPGANGSNPSGMVAMPGGLVIFTASDGENGIEMWESDGTPEGTLPVQDFNSAGDGFNALGLFLNFDQGYQFTRIRDGALFFARTADKGVQLFFGDFSPKKYYVNDTATAGDVLTTAAGSNSGTGTAAAPWLSLEYAYQQAHRGDTLMVDAGTYDFAGDTAYLEKSITLLGANYNVSPNDPTEPLQPNGTRNGEAIIRSLMINLMNNKQQFSGFTFEPGSHSALLINNASLSQFKLTNNIFRVNSQQHNVNTISVVANKHIEISHNRFIKQDVFFGTHIQILKSDSVTINHNAMVVSGSEPRTQNTLTLGQDFPGTPNAVNGAEIRHNYVSGFNGGMDLRRLSNATVSNNFLENGRGIALYSFYGVSDNENLTISNNTIKNVPQAIAFRGPGQGAAVVKNISIRNNIIDMNAAIQMVQNYNATEPLIAVDLQKRDSAHGRINIEGNKINIDGDYGVALNRNKVGIHISGQHTNTIIRGNELNYAATGYTFSPANNPPHPTGIAVSSDWGASYGNINPLAVISIDHNKVNGFHNSVAVYDGTSTGATPDSGYGYLAGGVSLNINNNSFTNDSASINNGEVSQVINGGCNWYGSADGATVAGKVSSKTVRFTPYLNNGTDTEAATGFQPGANGCASITGFTPTEGEAGKLVVIYGEGFTGATGAAFNGTAAQNLSVTSDTTMVVTVPAGAVTGTVSVTKPSGTVISAINFFVIPPLAADTVVVCPGSNGLLISNVNGSSYQWQVDSTGSFANIANGVNYSDTQSDTLRLLNIPTSWNGHKFRCVVNGGANSKTFILKVANYWTGNGADNDWSNPLNWGCSGQVPDQNTEVVVNGGGVVLSQPTTVKSISVTPGATITVKPGTVLTIKPN